MELFFGNKICTYVLAVKQFIKNFGIVSVHDEHWNAVFGDHFCGGQLCFHSSGSSVGSGTARKAQDRVDILDLFNKFGVGILSGVAIVLLSQGVTTLDGVIVTHYDADHAAGVPGLLSRVNTKKIYLPDIADDGELKKILSETYLDKVQWVRENTSVADAISALTLIAAPVDVTEENESSLCVLFQPENCDILIIGDRGKTGEKALIQSLELPQIELLVAGHHGASNSTSFELLCAVQPETVVISTGGKYSHPSGDVLHRLELFGCDVWRTDLHGTLIFRR